MLKRFNTDRNRVGKGPDEIEDETTKIHSGLSIPISAPSASPLPVIVEREDRRQSR